MKGFRPVTRNRYLTTFVAFCFLFSSTVPLTGCGGGDPQAGESSGVNYEAWAVDPPNIAVPEGFFTPVTLDAMTFAAMSTTEQLAVALGVEVDTIRSFSFSAVSGTTELEDGEKTWEIAADHVLLTTGLGEDRGWGDRDLLDDGLPDSVFLTLELTVPSTVPPNDETTRSLVYNTQFRSAESIKEIWSNDYSMLVIPTRAYLHAAVNLTSRQGPTITRALDVEGKTTITVIFGVSDAENGSTDSGLVINSVYYSEFDAGTLTNPLPDDTKLHTGTYAWKRGLIEVPGAGLPFNFSVFYNSGERGVSQRMGRRWAHSYDWELLQNKDGSIAVVRTAVGSIYFDKEDDVYIPQDEGVAYRLDTHGDGHIYASAENKFYVFDGDGKLTELFDLNDNRILLEYDDDGNLLSIEDTRGNLCALSYDGKDRLITVNYADETEVSFIYNGDNDITGIFEPEGRTTLFSYNSSTGDLLTVAVDDRRDEDPPEVKLMNQYDGQHRVISQIDGKGAVTTKVYDRNWLSVTDPTGNVTTRVFDLDEQLIWEEDPTGARTSYAYDENGNRILVRSPLGQETRKEYDEKGNIVRVEDAMGTVTETTYNSLNLPLQKIVAPYDDPGFTQSVSYVYDERGNLLEETDPLGRTTSFVYTEKGQLEKVFRFDGSAIAMEYSEVGELVAKNFPDGSRIAMSFDTLGRKVSETDPLGNTTTITYDDLGRVIAETDPLGNQVFYYYDVQDRMYQVTYPDGSYNFYTFTPTGKLQNVIDPLGNVTSRTYSANDLLISKTDPTGRTQSFSYDSAGRLTEVRDSSGELVAEAEYDASGRRIAYWDAEGGGVFVEYDPLGRPVREIDPLGNTLNVAFDGLGHVISVTNGRGQETRYEYDAGSRVIAEYLPDGSVVRHTYDAMDRPVFTRGPGHDVIKRHYDIMGRMVARTDPHGHTVGYKYDIGGNLSRMIYPEGHSVRYSYDAAGHMTRVKDWAGRVTKYTYDALGRPVDTRLPDGSRVSRLFDAAGRLERLVDAGPCGQTVFYGSYTHDGSGRIQGIDSELPLPAPITTSVVTADHDAANQIMKRQEKIFHHDADGNVVYGPIGGIPMDLTYDFRNQLLSAGLDWYRYDADGLRIKASVHGITRRYVQDAAGDLSRILEERDHEDRVTARYVWGLGLLYRVENCDIAVYHYNIQGSTVALTDHRGRIIDRYSYDEYGKVIAHVGCSSNPFTFSGFYGVVADDNGLYFHRARYYEPGLRRFLQRDVMAGSLVDPGSMNRYAYGGGDPLNGVDPDGEFFLALIIGLVVGAVIGFTVDVVAQGISKGWDKIDWGQAAFAALEGAITGAVLGGAAGALAKASWYTVMAVEASVAMAANAGVQGLAYAAGVSEGFDWAEFGITAGLSIAIPAGGRLKSVGKKWARKTTKSAGKAGLRRGGRAASSAFKNYDKVLAELGTNPRFLGLKAMYGGIPAKESLGRQVWNAFKDNFASEITAGIPSLAFEITGGVGE